MKYAPHIFLILIAAAAGYGWYLHNLPPIAHFMADLMKPGTHRIAKEGFEMGPQRKLKPLIYTNEPKHFTWTISPKTIHSQDTAATKGDEK